MTGKVSDDSIASELTIWICEPKPVTLPLISSLKPSTTATDTIITAKPTAIPIEAMLTPSEEIRSERSLLRYSLRAIKSGKELITLYHVPYVFIAFNKKMFNIYETKAEDFLKFFVNNGYQISLKGFLTKEFISIEDLMKKKLKQINLYLVYIEP